MNISVNAPSYKRASKVLTLDYLPFCRIWVDCKEYEDYKANYPSSDIVSCPEGVQGNVARVRNYILDKEFERGMDVVCIVDDDLQAIRYYSVERGFGYVPNVVEGGYFCNFLKSIRLWLMI